jgi:hypothetical protein
VNGWALFFLGVIAVATLGTAIVQIGLVVYAGRLARRLTRMVDDFERELKPLLGSANAIGRDAARATALAVAQVERADRLFGDLAMRIDETIYTVQQIIIAPAREWVAILSGLRTAVGVFRGFRADRKRADDEEALFI